MKYVRDCPVCDKTELAHLWHHLTRVHHLDGKERSAMLKKSKEYLPDDLFADDLFADIDGPLAKRIKKERKKDKWEDIDAFISLDMKVKPQEGFYDKCIKVKRVGGGPAVSLTLWEYQCLVSVENEVQESAAPKTLTLRRDSKELLQEEEPYRFDILETGDHFTSIHRDPARAYAEHYRDRESGSEVMKQELCGTF